MLVPSLASVYLLYVMIFAIFSMFCIVCAYEIHWPDAAERKDMLHPIGMPGIFGAVDGTHSRIRRPSRLPVTSIIIPSNIKLSLISMAIL